MNLSLNNQKIKKFICDYYSQKFKEFGATNLGVDWNNKEGQYARFELLLKYMKIESGTTVLDYGCGYGEMFTYIINKNSSVKYLGYDLVESYIKTTNLIHKDTQATFVSKLPEKLTWDYIVLSGVFNVKGKLNEDEWLKYVISEIETLFPKANKGLSFNMLTAFNDINKRKDYLFYIDPFILLSKLELFRPYSIILDHSYPMYEFTITILK